jgi:hypothetical protein
MDFFEKKKKKIGREKKIGQKKIGRKKIWLKKNLVKKKIWPKKVLAEKNIDHATIHAPVFEKK